MTNELNKVCVITSAHGIRGQVKIHSFSENPESVLTTPLTDATGKRQFKLTRHGIKDRQLIVSIDGIIDRNAAELLKGTELFAPIANDSKTEGNRWSYASLTGMEARLIDGNVYGRVIGVYNFGAGDVIDIELDSGGTEMLPFTDDFVGDVQAEEGYLVVFPPDYVDAGE